MTLPEIRVDHLTIIRPGEVHVDVMVQIKGLDRDQTNALLDDIVAASMSALYIGEQECTCATARPEEQESGVCNHLDADDLGEVECTYNGPGPYDGACPYLDSPDVICPIKLQGGMYAMREVARMRAECEQEQEEQDRDMENPDVPRSEYVLTPPPAPAAKSGKIGVQYVRWSPAEDEIVEACPDWQLVVKQFRAAFPDSLRTDAAIERRWRTLHNTKQIVEDREAEPATEPEPEPVEEVPAPVEVEPEPVEEEPIEEAPAEEPGPSCPPGRKGTVWIPEEDEFLSAATGTINEVVEAFQARFPGTGRTRSAILNRRHNLKKKAQEAGSAGSQEAEPSQPEEPPAEAAGEQLRPGDRVALVSDPDRVGEVILARNGHVSVQFPGDGPARVFALNDLNLRRLVE